MWIFLALLVSIIGLLMYALSTNGKLQTIGLDMFWVGLLAFLIQFPAHVVSVLGH